MHEKTLAPQRRKIDTRMSQKYKDKPADRLNGTVVPAPARFTNISQYNET